MSENYLGGETKGIEDTMRDLRDEIERCAQHEAENVRLQAEIDRLKAENVRLQAEVDYQIAYTKKRGNQMLLDMAEINRLKAEINRVSDAWLSAYIFETKREGTECHPDRRFRVVMPRGGDQWFATHDEAKKALLKAVME